MTLFDATTKCADDVKFSTCGLLHIDSSLDLLHVFYYLFAFRISMVHGKALKMQKRHSKSGFSQK